LEWSELQLREGIPMIRRNWKRTQPTSLRQALELCKDHARERLNLSVESIAERMGITDHWTLYKWMQNGRIPANMIHPFELACGIDYITRWLAGRAGRLLIEVPSGRNATPQDMQTLQELLHTAAGQLMQFYAGKAEAEDVLAAIQQGMEGLAWHKGNVEKHLQPEFEFS
jgi:transcriptional regulator with XRE-family HTH domain